MSQLNTFQSCLIQYAGFTGATGGVVPIVEPGYKLAGTFSIDIPTTQVDIAVPATAKNIVVLGRDIDITAGAIGVFIVSGSNSFGADITPSAITNQQVLMQAYSPNSLTWVGSSNVGAINDVTEAKTEMLAGTLLAPLLGVTVSCTGGGDLTDGVVIVMYQ